MVRRINGPTKKGIHRVAWDLRFPAGQAIAYDPSRRPTADRQPKGHLVVPGEYTVALSQHVNGVTTELAPPQPFQVDRMRTGALPGAETAEVVAFWQRLAGFQRKVTAATQVIAELDARLTLMKQAIARAQGDPAGLDAAWHDLRSRLFAAEEKLAGNRAQAEMGTAAPASVRSRLGKVLTGTTNSTYGPTRTHEATLSYAEADYTAVAAELADLQQQGFPALESALNEAGAPWTPGSALPHGTLDR